MFSAIILACSLTTIECKTFGNHKVFKDYEKCITSLGNGIIQVDMQGWKIENYTCYKWPEEV